MLAMDSRTLKINQHYISHLHIYIKRNMGAKQSAEQPTELAAPVGASPATQKNSAIGYMQSQVAQWEEQRAAAVSAQAAEDATPAEIGACGCSGSSEKKEEVGGGFMQKEVQRWEESRSSKEEETED